MNRQFAPVILLLAGASLASAQSGAGPRPAGAAGTLTGLSRVHVTVPPLSAQNPRSVK